MTPAKIPIARVRVGARKRPLDSAKVAELAASIAELGLLQPIGIRPDGTLVYGYHRLEACKQLGWTEIPAVVVDGDDLRAELAELSESLLRNELTLLDRAEHLAQLKAVYEQLHPNARGVGRPAKNSATVAAFSEWAAAQAGLAQRTIRHYVQLAESVAPEVRDAIRRTPIANDGRELQQLASLEPSQQRAVAELIASREAGSVREATRELARREALQREDSSELPAQVQIRHGDFRVALADIPPRSVDAIITDPPYPAEYIPLFDDLGALAARVLKPDGVLIAYSGQAHLIDGLTALASHLRYWWTLALRHQHAGYVVNGGRRVINRWKPLLLFTRKDGCAPAEFADLVEGTGREKELHVWQQAAGELGYLLETFTRAGDLVIDPFVGSGTTAVACLQLGRRFIGCDIDAGAVAIARRRVQDAIKGGEQR
jgi:ParB/RepB/Spo0J family partition protein